MGCAVEAECSPAVEAKITFASTRNRSYEEASDELRDLAELDISAKRCARITQRIGRERLKEREMRCVAFEQRTLLEQQQGVPPDAPAVTVPRGLSEFSRRGGLGVLGNTLFAANMGLSPSARAERHLVRPSAAGGGKSQTGRTMSQSPGL